MESAFSAQNDSNYHRRRILSLLSHDYCIYKKHTANGMELTWDSSSVLETAAKKKAKTESN